MLFFRLRASPVFSTNLKTLANIAKPTPNMQTQHLNRQFLGCYSNCSLGRVFSSTISPLSFPLFLISHPCHAFLNQAACSSVSWEQSLSRISTKGMPLGPSLSLSSSTSSRVFGSKWCFRNHCLPFITNAVRVCDWFAFSRVFCIIAMYLLSFSFFLLLLCVLHFYLCMDYQFSCIAMLCDVLG